VKNSASSGAFASLGSAQSSQSWSTWDNSLETSALDSSSLGDAFIEISTTSTWAIATVILHFGGF